MNTYDVGDQVRITVQISDADGVAVDPTLLTCFYRDPVGIVTERVYETDEAVIRDGAGAYYVDLVANRSGVWVYRWECSGTVTAAVEGQFTVRRSSFA